MRCLSCSDDAGTVHHPPLIAKAVHGSPPICGQCGRDDEMGVWDADHPSGVRWFCLRCRYIWRSADCDRRLSAESVELGDRLLHDGQWSHVAVAGPSADRWVIGLLPSIVDATHYVTFDRDDVVTVRRG